jgi:twitching motility protein PilT
MDVDDLLKLLLAKNGSDLHMKVGLKPVIRLKGELEIQEDLPQLLPQDMEEMCNKLFTETQRNTFDRNKEVDTSYELSGVARFRGNIFMQKGQVGAVFRMIPSNIPTIDEMGYPDVLKEFTKKKQGLILITGPTGSGKSTTLAAMIDHINRNEKLHIVTIEDPLEFIHVDHMSIVNQREIGFDTMSFSNALRAALRQDPDVILIGELRDAETIQIAMTAAETGHLVFSTLHTNDAKQTVDRIIDTFDPKQQNQVRMQLANVLYAALSQKLIPRADHTGRVAVMEIMINSPMIKKMIEENKSGAIQKAMEESTSFYGMQTFNLHLFKLIQEKLITEEDGLAVSPNPHDLKIKLQTSNFQGKPEEKKIGLPGAPRVFSTPPPKPGV